MIQLTGNRPLTRELSAATKNGWFAGRVAERVRYVDRLSQLTPDRLIDVIRDLGLDDPLFGPSRMKDAPTHAERAIEWAKEEQRKQGAQSVGVNVSGVTGNVKIDNAAGRDLYVSGDGQSMIDQELTLPTLRGVLGDETSALRIYCAVWSVVELSGVDAQALAESLNIPVEMAASAISWAQGIGRG